MRGVWAVAVVAGAAAMGAAGCWSEVSEAPVHGDAGGADEGGAGAPDDPPGVKEDVPAGPGDEHGGGEDAPAVAIVSPADGAHVTNPVTFEVSGAGVAWAQLWADGTWALTPAFDPSAQSTVTYTFSTVNAPRAIELRGHDAAGAVVATDAVTVTVDQPDVEILSPADGSTVVNPVSFSLSSAAVARLRLTADGYALGEWAAGTASTFTYTFNGTGYPREVVLAGLDASGATIDTDAVTVTVSSGTADVPYFFQQENAYEPCCTCGITSAAMVIDTWRPSLTTPDALYVTYGKAQGQSPSGLAELYTWHGLYARSGTGATRAELKAHLDAGRPVAVHGWWTDAGHIAVLIGYDATGWTVHDPAGDYEQCYLCGIPGEAVRYAFGSAWDDAMSGDGDIWYSVAADYPI